MWGYNHRPSLFPSWISYKVTKAAVVSFDAYLVLPDVGTEAVSKGVRV